MHRGASIWRSHAPAQLHEAEVRDLLEADVGLVAAHGEARLNEPVEDLADIVKVLLEGSRRGHDEIVDVRERDSRWQTAER